MTAIRSPRIGLVSPTCRWHGRTSVAWRGCRGSRYSWGYPACPDLDDQAKLDELLELHRIGVKLTEEFQLEPEQSTSAIIVPHPEAKYFVV